MFHSRPVHSLMLSSHRFLCLPLRPDGVSNSGFHFLIGYVISVRDTEEFAETSHLQCLYPSFNVCCYGPRFTCIQKYGHGQGTHQSDLGADGDVLVVPDDFYFGHCSSSLAKQIGIDINDELEIRMISELQSLEKARLIFGYVWWCAQINYIQ